MSVGLLNKPIKQLIATKSNWFAAGEALDAEPALQAVAA
jgi:hypothetical protein